MADLIRVKCGEIEDRDEMPTLSFDKEKGAEIGYRTDEKALYIGTENGNVRLCGAGDIESIIARLDALESKN